MKKTFLLFFLAFVSASGIAQKLKKDDRVLLANLQKHIVYLSDDKLEGRRTGTAGEKQAAEYIANQFKALDLKPAVNGSYFQEFSINEGKAIDKSTALSIDGNLLELNKDFFPLAFSGQGSLEAMPSLSLQETEMPWFLDLKDILNANEHNPHFDLYSAIDEKVKEVHSKGASALFLYNTEGQDVLKFDGKDRRSAAPIPIVYVTKVAAKNFLNDPSASLDINLNVKLNDVIRKGSNVVGYLDMGASNTIIIGAHYDHLGLGEDGNSRATAAGDIHNGADDNASGTAAIIELARMVKSEKLKKHNYLFIAFSGEELGLYGSKYFTENPTIDLGNVNYMINLDMVGRLNADTKTLTVGGYGTSPAWGQFYATKGKKGLYAENLHFKFDSSGTGPSDHTSFYRKSIPVLFYFTGLHTDYHKPSDDHDKINYLGQLHLVKHVLSVVEATDKHKEKLAFTKTREAQTTTSARFSVSLGVMPDYTFSGQGLRVDGVSEGKTAQKVGMKAGDIVTAIGDFQVTSMESYMQALSKFKKGDKTVVQYQREGKTNSVEVEF